MRRWIDAVIGNAPKVARVLVFGLVVYGVAFAWAARSARAEVDEILLGLGADMMHHPRAHEGELQTLMMNGAQIQVRTGHLEEPIGEVLDFFETRCQEHDGQTAAQLQELIEQAPELQEIDVDEVDATMRFETSHRGYVSCLDTGTERVGHETFIQKIESFLDSGNVSEIGHMRYLYAERVSDEDTFFVTVFTDDDLNLYEMFPETGDAPGEDPEGIARPPNARRIFDSHVIGDPYSMTVYTTTTGTEEEVTAHYRTALPSDGWHAIESTEGETVRIDGVTMLVYARGEELTTIYVGDSPEGTTATVLKSDREP